MDKSKCMQMVGRARVSDISDRKTLYMKRFCADEVDKRIKNLRKQQDAYHSYELAYDKNGNACSPGVYQFFNKYYSGEEGDWKDAKHWFGISFEETKWYLNEIAQSFVEKLIPQYQYIFDEMEEEKNDCKSFEGQKYLENQLSWFGKKYFEDDDITYADKEKAREEFLAFLESYAEKGTEFVAEGERGEFTEKFIELFDVAFKKSDKNSRQYGAKKMNIMLEEQNIDYKIDGKPQVGPWTVTRFNRQLEHSQS